ncbi:hypothetical protein ACFQX8_08625 [Klenkia terrae]|uniref:hypothetical protein n=1 Tax=Klenkia terrae TaxID=1052259 RepID=UPI003616C997
MDLQDVLSQTRDAITVRRVFADPVQVDGVTVITAAAVGAVAVAVAVMPRTRKAREPGSGSAPGRPVPT